MKACNCGVGVWQNALIWACAASSPVYRLSLLGDFFFLGQNYVVVHRVAGDFGGATLLLLPKPVKCAHLQ